jgi:arginyl-tRNA synthetase
VRAQVVEVCTRALGKAFPGVELPGYFVTEATKPEFGDYQNNTALTLYGKLKGAAGAPASPRATAERLLEAMREVVDEVAVGMLGKLEVAGAGFINIHLDRAWLEARVLDAALHGIRPPLVRTCRALVDFSSPNVAKEMHVGHLRSTIIGDTICRVLEFCGFETHRVNHVGDWGTQFGMLIAHMRREHPDFLAAPPPIADLQKFYKAAKVRFDEDESFKAEAHRNVVALQAGDPVCRKAWGLICEASRNEFSKVYKRLDISLDEVGESFYNPYIPAVVASLERMGQVQTDGGAKVIFPPQSKHAIPLIVVKSDGGFNYDSTDLAAVWYRVCELQVEWVIYVVDAGQGPHFDLVFDAAHNAGWCTCALGRGAPEADAEVASRRARRARRRSAALASRAAHAPRVARAPLRSHAQGAHAAAARPVRPRLRRRRQAFPHALGRGRAAGRPARRGQGADGEQVPRAAGGGGGGGGGGRGRRRVRLGGLRVHLAARRGRARARGRGHGLRGRQVRRPQVEPALELHLQLRADALDQRQHRRLPPLRPRADLLYHRQGEMRQALGRVTALGHAWRTPRRSRLATSAPLTRSCPCFWLRAPALRRACAAQSGVDIAALKAARTPIVLAHPAEVLFGGAIARLGDKIEEMLRELQPHVICEYLYDACGKLNAFVRECRVINVAESPSRLMLCVAGLNTMRKCFELLGITWLERI